MSMASVLKNMLAPIMLEFADELNMNLADTRHACLEGKLKDKPLPLIGVSPREMMQTLGTEWGRGFVHRDLWVVLMLLRIEAMKKYGYPTANKLYVIIPDIRYDNECQLCDLRFEVSREGQQEIESSNHASEVGVSHPPNGMIDNSGDLRKLNEEVERALLTYVDELGWNEYDNAAGA